MEPLKFYFRIYKKILKEDICELKEKHKKK